MLYTFCRLLVSDCKNIKLIIRERFSHDEVRRFLSVSYTHLFITSKRLDDKIQEAKIHQQIFGSDHCPVELDIDL